MSTNPLVIIHGWSDQSASFKRLASLLQPQLNVKPKLINLADYLTMDDAITYDDIIERMLFAWKAHRLPLTPFSVDVIVHSTGGLIIRDWITKYFTPNTVPIKHCVMLAPANFGSPLAHKGRAFYGRIVKGLKGKKLFHVGANLLRGLELASPYTWQLAQQDCFSNQVFYGQGKILTTVLIGDTGYTGISAAGNEAGSDGTVRISSANLNCAYLDVDFMEPKKPSYKIKQSKGSTAFAVIKGENHSTIVAKDKGHKNTDSLELIVQALTVKDNEFNNWCNQLSQLTQNNLSDQSQFQNTVVIVRDQFDTQIQDYFIEFYAKGRKRNFWAGKFHGDLIKSVHAYQANKNYRNLYINCSDLDKTLKVYPADLQLSLTAIPEMSRNGDVGYQTFDKRHASQINIPYDKISEFFVSNRTLLVKINIKRLQSNKVFQFENLTS